MPIKSCRSIGRILLKKLCLQYGPLIYLGDFIIMFYLKKNMTAIILPFVDVSRPTKSVAMPTNGTTKSYG